MSERIKYGSYVYVPRSAGGTSLGIVEYTGADYAIVSFPTDDSGKMGQKTIRTENLKPAKAEEITSDEKRILDSQIEGYSGLTVKNKKKIYEYALNEEAKKISPELYKNNLFYADINGERKIVYAVKTNPYKTGVVYTDGKTVQNISNDKEFSLPTVHETILDNDKLTKISPNNLPHREEILSYVVPATLKAPDNTLDMVEDLTVAGNMVAIGKKTTENVTNAHENLKIKKEKELENTKRQQKIEVLNKAVEGLNVGARSQKL